MSPEEQLRIAADVLATACDEIRSTGSGTRNIALNNAALRVAHFVGSKHLDQNSTMARLMAAAKAAGMPTLEAGSTIRSAFRKGTSEPAFNGSARADSGALPIDCHPLYSWLLEKCPIVGQPNVLKSLRARGIPENACADVFALPHQKWQGRLAEVAMKTFGRSMVAASGLFKKLPATGEPDLSRLTWPNHRLGIIWRCPDGYAQTIERRLVGPGGNDTPRWVFSTGRPALWPLGAHLLWKAEPARPIAIVEGPSDILALRWLLHQQSATKNPGGVPLVVALPSALRALKPEWLSPLSGRRVYVALDGDEAGETAAQGIIEQLHAVGIDATRWTPPAGAKDWADTLKSSPIPDTESRSVRDEKATGHAS